MLKHNRRVLLRLTALMLSGACFTNSALAATYEIDVTTNTSLTTPVVIPPGYTQVTYGIGNGATLTLAPGSDPKSTFYALAIPGGGVLVNNTSIVTTGPAILHDGTNVSFTGYVSLVNNGSILAAVNSNQYAVASYGYGFISLNNTGSITATGAGGAVNADVNSSFTNSGSVIADGMAVHAVHNQFVNSGTIRSNGGVGLYLFGNQGAPATNSGTIYGATVGTEQLGYTLTNSGTIASPGIAASVDPYGALVNTASGRIEGNVGAVVYGYTFRAGLDNAGRINGNVNFGTQFSDSQNVFIARPGSVVTGNLVLGGGGDVFVTSLVNNGPGQFAGVNGTVTGNGNDTIRYLVSADASRTSLGNTSLFTNVSYDLLNNAKLTLAPGTVSLSALGFTGTGTVDLTANISAAQGYPILDLRKTGAQIYGAPATSGATALDFTSRGTLSGTRSGTYYWAPLVLFTSPTKFTNTGTIAVQDATPLPIDRYIALRGDGVVVNSGTISLLNADGIALSSDGGPLAITNSGIIGGLTGDTSSRGIFIDLAQTRGAITIQNTGTISTAGAAVTIRSGLTTVVTNSGRIASAKDAGIYTAVAATLTNQFGGIISGASYGISFNGAGAITNAGMISGGTYAVYAPAITSLTLQTGSSLVGDVLGSGALVLQGSGTEDSRFFNFTSATMQGPGTWTLSGASTITRTTVSGGTLIVAGALTTAPTINTPGTLQIGNGGTIGSISGNVTDNGALVFNRNDAVTFAGVISGTGSLTQAGTGTLILTGANTYTGSTTVNAGGTLQFGNGGSGSLVPTGPVTDNGVLAFSTTSGSLFSVISGTGRVVVTSGLMLFGSNSTYTGGTTINSGATLQLGGNSNLSAGAGAVVGDIVNNGTLLVQRSGVLMLDGIVSGAGALSLNTFVGGANGTVILTGNNSYAGGTTINGGTLQIGNGGTAGAITGNVVDNAELAFNRADNVAFGGAISGAGTLTQAGAGTLTLSGISSLTGGTTVSSGTLNVTGSIATSAVTVKSGAILAGTGTVGATSVTGTLSPGGSGIGTLAINGALSLAAASTTIIDLNPTSADKVTVNGAATIAGTLNANFAAGTYSLTRYTLFTSNDTLSGSFSGYNFSGLSGAFNSALSYDDHDVYLTLTDGFTPGTTTTINSGSVTVSGNQTTGGLQSTSPGGTLNISGGSSLTDNQTGDTIFYGPITGNGSFTKTGAGTLILDGNSSYIGGTNVNGGTLEIGDGAHPGASMNGPVNVNSGGTLSGHGSVNGAVIVNGGGNLQPGGTIGTLTVGSATFLSGSTYTVEANATGQANNTVATGVITINSGAKLVVTPDAPLTGYARATSYTILQAAGGITGTFSSATSTAATLLPSVSYAGNAVTLTLIRPDLLATAASTANQRSVETAIVAGGLSSLMTTLAPQSDTVVGQAYSQLAGDIHASLRSAAVEDSRIIRDTILDHLNGIGEGVVLWGAGFGGYGSISTDGNASGLHHDSAGVIAGADVTVGSGFRVGLAGAYTDDNALTSGKASSASGNIGHLVAYGSWSDGQIALKAGGDFGWGTTNVTRTVAAFSQTDASRQDQQTSQVFAEGGYRFTSPYAAVEPYAGIASISAKTGAFTETGGSTALSGGARTDTQAYGTLGLRASLAPMESLAGLVPHVDLGWQHAFSTLQPRQMLTFQSLNQSFTVLGAPLASDAVAARVGFKIQLAPHADLSLDYDGSFASRVQNNAVRGGLEWKF